MKELDNNQKARLADYLNGKPVTVSDWELQLMADSDELAAEIMDIASISAEVQMPAAQDAPEEKRRGRGATIRLIIMAAAACLVIGIGMGLMFQTQGNNVMAPSHSALAETQVLDQGISSMPADIEEMMQSASLHGAYDYPPYQPFDIVLSKSYNDDTLVLCNAQNQRLLKTRVNDNYVPIEGLAPGLYYYYLIYNPIVKGVLSIGIDE